jgi:REP element-mobilizing transposase RayT
MLKSFCFILIMAIPRKRLIDETKAGFYHCVSRCVRRAYLCGEDKLTGNDYEHRRGWVEARLKLLAGLFGIEVFAYAVMKNHLHVVLRNNPKRVASWDDTEVGRRWMTLFPGQRDKQGQGLVGEDGMKAFLEDAQRVAECRSRLGSLSWFMRCLNEPIARMANREDDCSGRFWEGRFFSQRLEDDGALFACMAYVDLNPVRAGIAPAARP